MRILALITDAFGGYGGIAKFNRDLLSAICTYQHTAEVVAISRLIPHELEPLPERLRYITDGDDNKLKYVLLILREIVRNSSFDLILCGHINLLPLAALAKRYTGSRVVLVIHGIEAWESTNSWIVNRLVRGVDVLISVSALSRERFINWTGVSNDNGYVLPNSVDLGHFTPGGKKRTLMERYGLQGKTVLMTLGRLVGQDRHKGYDEVIEALPALIGEIPDVCYLIVGKGNDRKRLEEKAKAFGVLDRVIFSGFVPEEEKVDHYRLADTFIMPSRGEGFGIVILEALACGVPVIASSVDGSREAVLDGELGILVDPSDQQEIKNAILEALTRPKGVVPEALEYFSSQRFENRCHQILDNLLP